MHQELDHDWQLNSRTPRRTFLRHFGAAAVATGLSLELSHSTSAQDGPKAAASSDPVKLPPLTAPTEAPQGEPPAPLPPEQRIGYAVVGLGHLAVEEVLPAFGESRKAKLVALVSGSPDKSQKLAQQYGIASKNILDYRNYDRLADIPEVQVVYIALPNSMHAEYSIRAARAGKHVLCEKPMAINPAECEQMIEASDRANRKLMIAYRIQYEPHNRAARDFVRTSRFGQIKYIESFNGQRQGDPTQWRLDRARSGGGSLVDLGVYCLNTIRFLLGEEPIEVSATIHSPTNDPRFRSVEDLITFNLRFPSGVLANCASSYDSHNSKRYRVFATEGWFGLDPAFPYRGLEMQTARAENKIEHIERPQITSKNQFATELDHMADCVMNNVKPFTPGEEGLQDQRIMNAIYESAKKAAPVKLRALEGKDVFRGPEPKL